MRHESEARSAVDAHTDEDFLRETHIDQEQIAELVPGNGDVANGRWQRREVAVLPRGPTVGTVPSDDSPGVDSKQVT